MFRAAMSAEVKNLIKILLKHLNRYCWLGSEEGKSHDVSLKNIKGLP